MTTPVLAAVRPSASTAARGARVALWGTVAGSALGVGHFTVGGVFAQLSDAAAGLTGVGLVPVVIHLHRREGRTSADAVLATGLAAAGGMIASSLGLIVSDTFQIETGRGFLGVQFLSGGPRGLAVGDCAAGRSPFHAALAHCGGRDRAQLHRRRDR